MLLRPLKRRPASQVVRKTADQIASFYKNELTVEKGREVLGAAIDKAKELADPDAAIRATYDAWTQFAAIPAGAPPLQCAGSPLLAGHPPRARRHTVP
jgi:hypothetical protein